MVWISDKQKLAMDLIESVMNRFGKGRWFTKNELPGITQHSMDALCEKGYLENMSLDETGIMYYKFVKPLE